MLRRNNFKDASHDCYGGTQHSMRKAMWAVSSMRPSGLCLGNANAVIVVDDGSSDHTANEIKSLISVYPRLRYIRHSVRTGQSAPISTDACKIGMRRFPWQKAPSMNAGGEDAEISVEFAGTGCALSPNSLCHLCDAGWSSPVARQAHNLKAA